MATQRPEIRPEASIRYKGQVYKRGDEDRLIEAGFGSDKSVDAPHGVSPTRKAGRKSASGADMVQRLTDKGLIVGFPGASDPKATASGGREALGVKPGETVAIEGARRDNTPAGQNTQDPANGGDGDEVGRTGHSRDRNAPPAEDNKPNASSESTEPAKSSGAKSGGRKGGGRKRS